MNCYLDSSIILRKLLGQKESLREWSKIQLGASSQLLRLECLRTLDRMQLAGVLKNADLVESRSRLFELLGHVAILPLTNDVYHRAEQSFPTSLGTLDSIHLATALLWYEQRKIDFVFATHDKELAMAAKAQGFEIIGV